MPNATAPCEDELECARCSECSRPRSRPCSVPQRASVGQQEGVSSAIRTTAHRRAGDQGRSGHTTGASDRLHRDPCRSGSGRGRRCSRVRARNDRDRPAESGESRAAGACGVPLRRQRVRTRRGDRRAEVSLRAENRLRDASCESADRAGRDPVRPRRRQIGPTSGRRPIADTARPPPRPTGPWPKGTSAPALVRRSARSAAAAAR